MAAVTRDDKIMPRMRSSIDQIRLELAWVNETPDPNKCGCRNVRCCVETGHKPGACMGAVATKFWTFRWEYYCAPCREYEWCGSKTRGYMTGTRIIATLKACPKIPTTLSMARRNAFRAIGRFKGATCE